jgi:hypothetical protein
MASAWAARARERCRPGRPGRATQDGLDPVGGEQSIQHGVGLLLVEPVECPAQLVGGQEADEWVEIQPSAVTCSAAATTATALAARRLCRFSILGAS